MLRAGKKANKGGLPKRVTIEVEALTSDSEPEITDAAIDPGPASLGSADGDMDSKVQDINAEDRQPKANLRSLVSLVDKYSKDPALIVHSSQVPPMNELHKCGYTKISGASNDVFYLKDNVCKFISLRNNVPKLYQALVLEVTCVMSKGPFWVGANGLFWTGSHLCIVMPKLIVMSNFATQMHAQRNPMPPGVLASMLRDWFRGLKALEKRKLLHGDVKPGNLLFDEDALCGKLGDFGSVGEHNQADKYTKVHGLPVEARCTLCYSLPSDVQNAATEVNSKFDVLSLYLSILQILLGNQHPVFALSALDGLSIEEKRYEFMATFLNNRNLLQALENEGKVPKIPQGPLRTVLHQMGAVDPEFRIAPSKAVELLRLSVAEPEQVRAFVDSVLV